MQISGKLWVGGGAVYAAFGERLRLEHVVADAYAAAFGGAVWSKIPIEIEGALFKHTRASISSGRAVYAAGVIITNTAFVGNSAPGSRGTISVEGLQPVNMIRAAFHSNHATQGTGSVLRIYLLRVAR